MTRRDNYTGNEINAAVVYLYDLFSLCSKSDKYSSPVVQ